MKPFRRVVLSFPVAITLFTAGMSDGDPSPDALRINHAIAISSLLLWAWLKEMFDE